MPVLYFIAGGLCVNCNEAACHGNKAQECVRLSDSAEKFESFRVFEYCRAQYGPVHVHIERGGTCLVWTNATRRCRVRKSKNTGARVELMII